MTAKNTLECTLVASIYGVIDMPDSEEAHVLVKTLKGNEFRIPATWETAKGLSGRNGSKLWLVIEPIPEDIDYRKVKVGRVGPKRPPKFR